MALSQMQLNARLSGGQTQSESAAMMTDRRLVQLPLLALRSIYDSLRFEASKCRTEAEYAPVAAQIDRVREAIYTREDALYGRVGR